MYEENILPKITNREREVLYALSQGLPEKQIADQLFIEPCTVNSHLRNIYAKLGVNNKVSAVIEAVKRGIIELF